MNNTKRITVKTDIKNSVGSGGIRNSVGSNVRNSVGSNFRNRIDSRELNKTKSWLKIKVCDWKCI